MTLSIIHNQNDQQIAANRAATALEVATANLAANLMRIVAGAGNPHEVFEQAGSLINAYSELLPFTRMAEFPYAPGAAIAKGATDFDWRANNPKYTRPTEEDLNRWERDGSRAQDKQIEEIARWALRWRAAQLLCQPTQESTAHGNIADAARKYAELRLL